MLRTVWKGALGGIAGTAVMTIGEKLEQRVTSRPDSYVPARTAARLFGLRNRNKKSVPRNWAMHYGTGAAMGVVRGVMAAGGLRGVSASLAHLGLRLATDEILENAVRTSKPPWTMPADIAAIDVGHKAVYALATGAFVDALVPQRRSSSNDLRPD